MQPINKEAFSRLLRYGRKCSGTWDDPDVRKNEDKFLPDDDDVDDLCEAWNLLMKSRGFDLDPQHPENERKLGDR